MDFETFQEMTEETAIYPSEFPDFVTPELVYVVVGFADEANEVLGKLKKAIREDDPSYLEDLPDEVGDAFWYAARTAEELSDIDEADFDGTIADIAESNLDKLRDRKERDVLEGEGDDR